MHHGQRGTRISISILMCQSAIYSDICRDERFVRITLPRCARGKTPASRLRRHDAEVTQEDKHRWSSAQQRMPCEVQRVYSNAVCSGPCSGTRQVSELYRPVVSLFINFVFTRMFLLFV